jgi:ribose transport system permease protein
MSETNSSRLSQFISEYGMLLVLLLLCAAFSVLTWAEQRPEGAAAGRQVAGELLALDPAPSRILIVAQASSIDRDFAAALEAELADSESLKVVKIEGGPRQIRAGLVEQAAAGQTLDAVAVPASLRSSPLILDLAVDFPQLGTPIVVSPKPYHWPTFLKAENLLNVTNQISEIAIVAVGMTIVIIAGGIDLSVGSLIALAAMTSTLLIQEYCGGTQASIAAMVGCSLAGIAVATLCGLLTGVIVTAFHVPPFVVTLAVMLAAGGIAGMTTGGEAAHLIPDAYTRFASGRPFGLPNAVVLMLALYVVAHIVMTRTTLGRYVYAVGGNRVAAHLSGIRTHKVLIFTYVMSACMAGLAGVVMASRLKSGNPTFGKSYELYVIAAVVVGGTSLSGGSGRIFGTLIGAFIIAVMQNGMNLLNGMGIVRIDDFTQSVVLGAVLLAAVIIDQLKRHGFRGWGRVS